MAYYYATPAGAGDNSGDSWANAFSNTDLETWLESTAAAGDTCFIAGGDYTGIGSIVSALDGTTANYITLIGVNSGTTNEPATTADWADGDNRPYFPVQIAFDNYWYVRGIRVENSASEGLRADTGATFINCKVTNTSNVAIRLGGSYGSVIGCEVIGGSSYCSIQMNNYCTAIGNYCTASPRGIYFGVGTGSVVYNNVITNMSLAGIQIDNLVGCLGIFGNTIYTCTSGVLVNASSYGHRIYNNIFHTCESHGVSVATTSAGIIISHNSFHSCGTNVWNQPEEDNNITDDPLLNDPANGDFTLQSGSPALNAAYDTDGIGGIST